MVVAFTTQGDAGGTLHFPSPTHIRHVDATSAFKQLRRSLSRSPSKASAFRLVNSKLASPSPSSPLSPDRDTLSHRLLSATVTSHANAATSSSLTTPYHPSAKKSRQPARRASPMRISSRSRNLPPSPGRSTLAELNDQGNSTPRPSGRFSNDIENRSAIPMNENMPEPLNKPSGASANINPSVPHPMLARLEKFSNSSTTSGAKSSPLKRSDGLMNLDQGNFGNPSAKRRSLHGASFGPDFDIFDYEASFQSKIQLQNDRASKDAASALDHPTIASPFPKRTSSLRKTTLQQRHDKPLLARAKMSTDIATDAITSGQATPKNRFRMSLDNYLPPMMRDSPFSSQGSLPTASAHPLNYQSSRVSSPRQPSQVQRHPLSRTITQSSSSSSMAEDSPTHIPIRHMENRRPIVDFTKSLPVGTARPVSSGDIPTNPSSQESFVQGSFATPDNYKLAKPLPAAFMSTGLISKRNKNVEDPEISFKASKDQMPDTPCKRHSLMGSTTPAPLPELAIGKSRHIRHSFGTPSTPFNPHGGRSVNGTLGNGVSIFGSGFNAGGINRRGSFASVEGDEYSQSPSNVADSQSSAEVALSTPTKQVVTVSNKAASQRTPSNRHDLDNGFGGDSPQAENENTSVHFGTPSGSADGDSDCVMDDSPSAALKSRSHSSGPSSFAVTRSARNHKSPTPLTRTFHTAPARLKSPRSKSNTLSPASPIESLFDRLPPQTPREGVMPPDPSGLSISAQNGGPAIQPLDSMLSNSFMFPPATPTASRDSRGVFGKSRSSLGSSVNGPIVETDSSLTSRFDKVDLIGTGEFSYVYRVRDSQESKNSRGYFSLPPAHQSPGTPLPDRVWAVKKTRNAYIGPRDRHRKIQEAVVLKALKYSDHVVQLFDYWENKGHLYIQTEFCEEGSLDLFLDQVGRKARLDDFRIWKIMLELALGLQHIHDSGFIHLDLKPANVLITFEGVLKIADFGMATRWPASPGIEGEGDREYIGPEILRGQFDKPSDIFALGLIMLEIAGNVMLPENGASWQRLRTGDMSDVPSLTSSSENSNVIRDSSGKPLTPERSFEDFYGSDTASNDFGSPDYLRHRRDQQRLRQPKLMRTGELIEPPEFMVDASNQQALDNVVRWMISPETADRPVVNEILSTTGVQWVGARRRAGATIYEGNWGPADDVLQDDAEMIDV